MDSNPNFKYPTDPRHLSPGELRMIADQEARHDINVWLNTGRTDHFAYNEQMPATLRSR